MPEQYNKLAEGIVKGSVPMVASFVERYITENEPGFFVGDREHIEGDIRVNVTVFGYLEQSDTVQLGVVDFQQLPDTRVWMVVGAQSTLSESESWLTDVYSAMVRRMAARLVQFGFLDAPNRPRLKAASTLALTQVAQALKPSKPAPAPVPAPEPVKPAPPAAPAPESLRPEPQAAAPRASEAAPAAPQAAPSAPVVPPPVRAVPSPASLAASQPLSPAPSLFNLASGQGLDLVLTGVMVVIWVAACGMLFYLLTLLLK